MSGRVNFVMALALALVLCALSLVNAQYQARRLFVELERSQSVARQLEIEWSQLQLDQSRLGLHSRIDALARKDLNMVPVTHDRTEYLTLEGK
jgi:cell division protein FtsL